MESFRLDQQAFPLVSVIIPFYRYVQWLAEAVESVLAQTYQNYEIIVINDGSSENVESFLNQYGEKIRYFYKENGGAASARNFGIQQAKGDYVAFLDSDDLWKKDKLQHQISKMMEYEAVFSYTDYEVFGDQMETALKQMNKQGTGMYDFVSPYIGTPTVIIKREVLLANELFFHEKLSFGEDSVLWNRLISRFPILYLQENLTAVRIRGGNAGMRAAVQIHARVKVYQECVRLIPNYKKKVSLLYRAAVLLCSFGSLFVKEQSKSKWNEYIARVFFLCPYILFRIDRRFGKKKIIRRAYFGILQRLRQFLLSCHRNNIFVLMFHDVCSAENDMPQLHIGKDNFLEFIRRLQEKNITFAGATEVFSSDGTTKCIITFDDVCEGAVLNAIPVLNHFKIPYTLFISPCYIGRKGYITADQIKELSQNPLCTIGFHAMNHRVLRELNREEIEQEINCEAFEKEYNVTCDYFAYPYGSVYAISQNSIQILKHSKYSAAFGTLCSATNKKSVARNRFYIPRIGISDATWKKISEKGIR